MIMLNNIGIPLGAVRLAIRRHCEANARPKTEAVRLLPWHVPHLQSEGALIIDALLDTVPGIRIERRSLPHPQAPNGTLSENHLLIGSGRYQVHGGFGSRTFLHADTPEETVALRRLYQAAWNELYRFRQKWTR